MRARGDGRLGLHFIINYKTRQEDLERRRKIGVMRTSLDTPEGTSTWPWNYRNGYHVEKMW